MSIRNARVRLLLATAAGTTFAAGQRRAPIAHRHDCFHQAIDEKGRIAYVDVLRRRARRDVRPVLARGGRWFARQGVRMERAKNDVHSRDFRVALVNIGARHKRTRPRWPQTERFNRTLFDEWAYLRPYESNPERLHALPDLVDRCNDDRPHSALKGLTPMAVLVKQHVRNYT
jgi:hypothetical protein